VKNGDIFHWSWREEHWPRPNDYTLSYWCKSRIAVVVDNELYDTYWGDRSHGWLDPERVDLDFKGNMNDYHEAKFGEHLYYAHEDKIDMRHPNNTNGKILIRNGAERSKVTMLEYAGDKLEYAVDKLEEAERKMQSAKNNAEWWTNKIKEIDGAADLKEVWL